MRVLALNTAFAACEAAVAQDGRILLERREAMARGQDARLALFVDEALTEAGLRLEDLDRLAVVVGPGSFTGVRIGVAFARGLALALDIPCIGVSSLEAVVPPDTPGAVLAVLPAQRREPDVTYWAQRFADGVATDRPSERVLDELVSTAAGEDVVIIGDGLGSLAARSPEARRHESRARASIAALRAAGMDPAANPAVPDYARTPDAAPMAR